mmetsp:Transcript_15575/g.32985  ORF Transcript_15575/g.32985 Transcript_15575/m.32985 type:complete len:92 (-) Transcript_15575:1356-1631(-)
MEYALMALLLALLIGNMSNCLTETKKCTYARTTASFHTGFVEVLALVVPDVVCCQPQLTHNQGMKRIIFSVAKPANARPRCCSVDNLLHGS